MGELILGLSISVICLLACIGVVALFLMFLDRKDAQMLADMRREKKIHDLAIQLDRLAYLEEKYGHMESNNESSY